MPLKMQGSVSWQEPRGENLDTAQFPPAAATGEDSHTVIQPCTEMDPSPRTKGGRGVFHVSHECDENSARLLLS